MTFNLLCLEKKHMMTYFTFHRKLRLALESEVHKIDMNFGYVASTLKLYAQNYHHAFLTHYL